ncbi:hypothetical protein MUK60_07670 [Streptomyces sp. LRE541]|uniref:hypothetical protein n=1 Tax=Streptomyces sp. LRE541 TaxID=2931983 RepID=UPI0020100465|nr:hypothetical protein [Streptomyces sp. LRE541]UPZ27712.1 hypothetical protein MUK60_07670 [Streptomyces sp. LRE541]
MGPMPPEAVDGLINAWLTVSPLIDDYGPVTVASFIPAAAFLIGTRVNDRRQQRRREQDGIRQLESYANHPANRTWKEKP